MAHPAAVAGGRLSAAPRHRVHPVGPVAQDGVIMALIRWMCRTPPQGWYPSERGHRGDMVFTWTGSSSRPAPGSALCGDWRSRWPEPSMTAWQLAMAKESRALPPATSRGPGSISKSRITAAMSVGLPGMWMGRRLAEILAGRPCRIGGAASRPGWPPAGEP